MAPRAKPKDGKPRPQSEMPTQWLSRMQTAITAMAWLGLAAASSPISQLSLSPVYGAIPAYLSHKGIMTVTIMLVILGRTTLKRYLPRNVQLFVPVFAHYVPLIQFILFKYSSSMGPVYGPAVTEALTFVPLLFFSTFIAANTLDKLNLAEFGQQVAEIAPVLASYFTFSFLEKASSAFLPRIVGSQQFLTRTGLQILLGFSYSILSPSIYLLLAIPAVYHTTQLNPHHISAASSELLNSTLAAYNYTVLERKESLTGYLSVLKNYDSDLVALRCDHSLLGGEWLVTPERQAQGMRQPEPIYSVFSMLEGVRLVETDNDRPDSEKSALVM